MGSSKKRVSSPFHPRYAGSWLALGVLRLLGAVPMPALYHAGTFLGDLLRLLVPSRRRIAERNLALCFPDQPKQQVAVMARENIRNTARMLLYTGFVWWAPREKLMNRVRVRNPQVLEQCLKTGRGIVILAPHFLALELGGVFLSLHYGGVSVYQRTRNPVFDRFMLRARQRFGARLFERKSDLKQMIRAIREYYARTGVRVGYKPAGGISKAKDAITYLALMKEELGDRWLQPDLFRFGASSLLGDIERQLEHHVTGNYSAAYRHATA